MDDTKHTPGPWGLSEIDDGVGFGGGLAIDAIDPADGRNFEVCEVWGIDDNRDFDNRARANARLIAAAPDMLAALEFAVGAAMGQRADPVAALRDIEEQLRAVIAKATKAAI